VINLLARSISSLEPCLVLEDVQPKLLAGVVGVICQLVSVLHLVIKRVGMVILDPPVPPHLLICYDTDCLVRTDYDTASVRKRPRTYLGITICLPFIFRSIPKGSRLLYSTESSVTDGSASEALQTSCMVQGLCTVHRDVLPSMYCTWRRSPFCVLYMVMPHSHTCIKGS